MAHRKWKETKQQPGTAGPGNILGCCLISFHFMWAIHPIRPVIFKQNTIPYLWVKLFWTDRKSPIENVALQSPSWLCPLGNQVKSHYRYTDKMMLLPSTYFPIIFLVTEGSAALSMIHFWEGFLMLLQILFIKPTHTTMVHLIPPTWQPSAAVFHIWMNETSSTCVNRTMQGCMNGKVSRTQFQAT